MRDGIIKADGTSRLLRADLPATYEELRTKAAAGEQPLDMLFNSAGWSQQPTFLNKANLLQDTTAARFGLDGNATVNEALAELSRFHAGLGNEYLWSKTQETWVETMGNNGLASTTYMCVTMSLPCTLTYAASVTFEDDGTVVLVNPSTIQMTSANYTTVASTVAGKYVDLREIYESGNARHGVMKIPEGDTFYKNDSNWVYLASCFHGGDGNLYVNGSKQSVFDGFVNSPSADAYPIDDGCTYTALGQLGGLVQVEYGTYVGTETTNYTVPLSFTPKLLVVFQRINANNSIGISMTNVGGYITSDSCSWQTEKPPAKIITNGFMVGVPYNTWLNESGVTGHYVAIG